MLLNAFGPDRIVLTRLYYSVICLENKLTISERKKWSGYLATEASYGRWTFPMRLP